MFEYVIIGNGVAGATAAQSLVQTDPAAKAHILGEEPYPYYYRPRLWEFLAGEIEQSALYFRPVEWYATQRILVHLGTRAIALDPAEHRLTLATGEVIKYDHLLLATGARPFVPPIAGANRTGVFTLRTIDDALAIRAYAAGRRRAVVIGGGLLGLETARALSALGLEVIIVESAPHLLSRQLDGEGAQMLQARLQVVGLRRILTNVEPIAILGNEAVTGVQLKDGQTVAGELVLVSAGILPQVELARAAGLAVNRGVVVDQHLRTSAADIYAAGDVAEFEKRVYGLVPPTIEQARVAAANMMGSQKATYSGTLPSATLKIVGIDLASLGEASAEGSQYVILRQANEAAGLYKRLVLRDGVIVGAILLGDKQSLQSLKQLITTRRNVSAYKDQLLDEKFDLKALAQGQLSHPPD